MEVQKMWNRSELKFNAKKVLKNKYFILLAASIIIWIFGVFNFTIDYNTFVANVTVFGLNFNVDYQKAISLAPIILIITFLWSTFIYAPLSIGVVNIHLNAKNGAGEMKDVFAPFKNNYLNNCMVMLWMTIKVFLWSLLLFIPGIIKSYAYYFVPYIILENPNMKSKDVLDLSQEMTRGHKLDLFVLNLSFFGWILLATIALPFTMGLSYILIQPYTCATDAQAYNYIKEEYNNKMQ